MGLTEWRARYSTFVCLTRSDEVTNSPRELLISFNNVEDVSDDKRAVAATDIHLTIVMN